MTPLSESLRFSTASEALDTLEPSPRDGRRVAARLLFFFFIHTQNYLYGELHATALTYLYGGVYFLPGFQSPGGWGQRPLPGAHSQRPRREVSDLPRSVVFGSSSAAVLLLQSVKQRAELLLSHALQGR